MKRKELKAIISAFRVYNIGCAYCPGDGEEQGKVYDLLKEMKVSHSAKVWGR